jgi:hypothetical protein
MWLFSQGVDKKANALRNEKNGLYDSRIVDNMAPLASIVSLCDHASDQQEILNILLSTHSESLSKNIIEDEVVLWDVIMNSIIS